MEAIKGAVAAGLGAAFVSAAAVKAEVAAGQLAALRIDGVPLTRTLRVVTDPVRSPTRTYSLCSCADATCRHVGHVDVHERAMPWTQSSRRGTCASQCAAKPVPACVRRCGTVQRPRARSSARRSACHSPPRAQTAVSRTTARCAALPGSAEHNKRCTTYGHISV